MGERLNGAWSGLTSKLHMATDVKGRMLSAVLTAGNINDTTMMAATLEQIRVPRPGRGRPRTRPDRLLADKGYTSKANRIWLADRGIKATIREKSDQSGQPETEGLLRRTSAGLRQRGLQRAQRRRTWIQPAQKLAWPRHEVRQDRPQLPGRR
jgi:transposase